jgi:hypothetical protein
LTIFRDVDHLRSRAMRDALELFRAARGIVEGDTGLMRGFEFDLVADGGSEGIVGSESQTEGQEEGGEERCAADGPTDRALPHVMASFWRATWWSCAAVCPTTAAAASPALAPCGLYASRAFVGRWESFIGEALEEEASGDLSDRHRQTELCSP